MTRTTTLKNDWPGLSEIRIARDGLFLLLLATASPRLVAEDVAVDDLAGEPAAPPASAAPETAKVGTEDAPTVDPGRTEINLTYEYGHAGRVFNSSGHVRDRGTLDLQVFTLTAKRGLVDGLDAALSVAWQNLIEDGDDEFDDGIGNLAANVKWRFFQNEDETVVLAWLPGFTAPFSGARNRDFIPLQDYWSIDNLAVLTLVGERLNLSLDAGYVLPFGGDRDDDRGSIAGNVAVGYQLTFWFQPEIELNYEHGFVDEGDDSDTLGVTVGVILNLPRDTRIDLGVNQTFYGRNTELATTVVANFVVTF